MDFEQFEQKAAVLEYCNSMSRFDAETEAARQQGKKRWEFINANRMGNSSGQRNNDAQPSGNAADNVSRVQRSKAKQEGSMLVGDIQAGRGAVDVLALSVGGRAVL